MVQQLIDVSQIVNNSKVQRILFIFAPTWKYSSQISPLKTRTDSHLCLSVGCKFVLWALEGYLYPV